MKNKYIVILLLLFAIPTVKAQVLWTENFDNYNTGTFTTGQGGWDVTTYGSDIQIITEPGKGNVLAWGWNYITPGNGSQSKCKKKGFAALWNTRTTGNNVLKLEFDFYSKDFTNSPGQVFQTGIAFDVQSGGTGAFFRCVVNANESYVTATTTYPTVNYRTAYNHTWIKVEVYIEYNASTNTSYVYTYIPLLNYLAMGERKGINFSNNDKFVISSLVEQFKQAFTGSLMKYDNFKLTAIPSRPTHVGVSEWVSSKFNIYPNPAANVVNISNSENMLVNQITIYDITGKQLSTQNYNNETQIQLNVENLAGGTYMLHIQTNEGLAVKKLIKK